MIKYCMRCQWMKLVQEIYQWKPMDLKNHIQKINSTCFSNIGGRSKEAWLGARITAMWTQYLTSIIAKAKAQIEI